MSIIRKEFTFPAANGEGDIFACIWQEEGRTEFKAVVQLTHGMAEYILRYEAFAAALCHHGYLVCGQDHAGHGHSVCHPEDFGYFGEEDNSWRFMEADMRHLMTFMQNRYPGLPYVILGHSMGSFLSRRFAADYGEELAAAVFVGTGGGNPLVDIAIILAKTGMKKEGAKSAAPSMNKLAFSTYNQRFERRTEFDWLNTVQSEVDAYIADPLCGYLFTYAGYRDLFQLLKNVSGKKWANQIPKELPIYLVSGADDPVGNFGKGVVQVYDWLKGAGCKDVSLKLYPGGRHEILNESNKVKVYHSIIRWLDAHVS